jgi:F-type H+-transporting ATPase subunit a
MTTRKKVLLYVFGVLTLSVVLFGIFGSEGRNNEFKPQDEFQLTPWISLKIGALDLSITRAVFYLIIAATLTTATMVYIARRMSQKPNRVQTAVEASYDLTFNNIVRGNMNPRMAVKWFPFVATLFFFIWWSNMIGYIPLPTNTHEHFNVFGLQIPAFAIYAATANISIPLTLSLVVWISYHLEGIRAKGPIRYVKGWLPPGSPKPLVPLIFAIEVVSQFVRLISLSVRLFANLLAGHLLILFMGGGLVVILGIAALGAVTGVVAIGFFMFEVILIATLQAFIFATLTAIYLGEAVAESH